MGEVKLRALSTKLAYQRGKSKVFCLVFLRHREGIGKVLELIKNERMLTINGAAFVSAITLVTCGLKVKPLNPSVRHFFAQTCAIFLHRRVPS